VSNFFKRTLTGAVFVIVVLGSVLIGSYTFGGLFFLVNILGLSEFYSLLEKNGIRVQKFSGIFLGSFLFVIIFLYNAGSLPAGFLFLPPAVLLFIFANELFQNRPNPFNSIAYTLLGIIYISLSLSLFITLPFIASGSKDGCLSVCFSEGYYPHILLAYFTILWTNDTGAYLIGSRFGKTRLLERISPKKSWEGVIGGIILGLIAAYILSNEFCEFTLLQWFIIAAVIMVTGIIGDLVESMFKRNIQVKDTSHILPGHGGILDRFDALIFSAPFVLVTVYFLSC
jgi:phosphatidate cytidylyltransferase